MASLAYQSYPTPYPIHPLPYLPRTLPTAYPAKQKELKATSDSAAARIASIASREPAKPAAEQGSREEVKNGDQIPRFSLKSKCKDFTAPVSQVAFPSFAYQAHIPCYHT